MLRNGEQKLLSGISPGFTSSLQTELRERRGVDWYWIRVCREATGVKSIREIVTSPHDFRVFPNEEKDMGRKEV